MNVWRQMIILIVSVTMLSLNDGKMREVQIVYECICLTIWKGDCWSISDMAD